MRAVFPFKRPERNAWLLAIPTLLIAFAVWFGWSPAAN
jgi:nitrate/nitrite transporter NarK